MDEHNNYCGELLAVNEFNVENPLRKIERHAFFENSRIFRRALWLKQIFFFHVLDHPSRSRIQVLDNKRAMYRGQMLSSIISLGTQPNKAIVGANAFAHEAGIHQDGFLKEPTTYEIINPKSVGVPESRLVLGKHSGRHALKNRCEDLGFHLSAAELDLVYEQVTALADNKKGLMDEEIAELARRSQQTLVPTGD